MDENKLRFGVGVLVISAIGIGIILVFLFGAFPSVLQREYALSVVFPSAEGISANTPVVRDGVRIGRVSSIDLREEGGVLVTLSMDSDQELSHTYIPRIGTGNFVTGDAKLEFVRATQPMLTSIFGEDRDIISRPYTDGEFIDYGSKSESLFEMQNDLQDTFGAIQTAGESIAIASESVSQLAGEMRQVIGATDSQVDDLSARVSSALEAFEGAMNDVRTIVGNPEFQGNLETSIAKFPGVLDDAKATLNSARDTFDTFEQVGVQFEQVGVVAQDTVKQIKSTVQGADQTVKNLEKITGPFAQRSDELSIQVLDTLTRLEEAIVQVEAFGRTLNNSNGTVKRILEDEDLYWEIRRIVQNIEQASARVRPIMDDVRIFTDKIARDPRELGVRGAINRRPSGVGLK